MVARTGRYGFADSTHADWSDGLGQFDDCDEPKQLYCFEQCNLPSRSLKWIQ